MPDRHQFVLNAPTQDQLDDLRKGTFEKYESEWTKILSTETHTFTHELDDVPCVVDVIRSDFDTGERPRPADENVAGGQELTVVKSFETIAVTNNVTTAVNGFTDFYFKVRAF